MLLGEWLKNNLGFVSDINSPSEEVKTELIGYILAVDYGNRILHAPIEHLAGEEVATFINMRYNSKWIKVSEYLENSYDIGTVNSKDITENFDGSITINSTGDVVNKESAFNTEDYVNSDKQENQAQNNHSNVNTRNRQENYKSYFSANKQIMNMNNEQLSNVIVKDIVNEICLKIY